MTQRLAGTARCVVLDAMGVIFESADDVAELLIPFVRGSGGTGEVQTIRSAYVDASLGVLSADEFWTAVGLDSTFEDEYLAMHALVPGALDFVRAAQNSGVAVWCLSNDVERWSRKLRASFGIDRLLSGAVISSEARARKPDIAIYRCLLDRCGYGAADILFVDDRLANVGAALATGIPSIEFGPDVGYRHLAQRLFGTALS